LGCTVISNDINPVASLIQKATIEYPSKYGDSISDEFNRVSALFRARIGERLSEFYPQGSAPNRIDLTYLWARTVACPYCDGLVPLSPNWRLGPDGTGVRLIPECGEGPETEGRVCSFEIVHSEKDHSAGTVSDGDGTCPFPDCRRIISGEDIKSQAQSVGMGEQLFAVACKHRVETVTSTGRRGRDKWQRGYRAPSPDDNISNKVAARLEDRLPEWQALDVVPTEDIPDGFETGPLLIYGIKKWSDLFSKRQLLSHIYAVEEFKKLSEEERQSGDIGEITRAALVYLAFAIDKMIDYGSRQVTWHAKREVIDHTFRVHGFRLKWSHAEMGPLVDGMGFDWAIKQTAICITQLVELVGSSISTDLVERLDQPSRNVSMTVSCKSGDALTNVEDASVDVVVMDPPYYDNVMYAELSDFFYVWLKRTAGSIVPELFTRHLTDKEAEAVANPAKFDGQKGAKALAGRDYQERMARIFEECRRVLKANGIMTLMFTHKATGAWDALTTGLMKAGFSISASWPINTEAEGSLHIKDKSAANSTIFLVCRPNAGSGKQGEPKYWEDVEPTVSAAVRQRIPEFQSGGISGVDLYLASFGPALEEFSKHWPLRRGTPRVEPSARKRKQASLFDEVFDPYAVSPEDALEAARREVKTWRLNQLMHMRGKDDLDPVTSWFVLAWDAFKAPVFAYDEGLRLARAVGADLDTLIGRLCEKKGSDVKLWDSSARAAKGTLGPVDGSRGMIDVIHHVAHLGRSRTVEDACELLTRNKLDSDPTFLNALEAVLEVLPPSKSFLGFEVATGDAKSASDDFDALERLRRVAFADAIDQPKQLELFAQEAALAIAEATAA
jgi:adenine-specific DNA methylase